MVNFYIKLNSIRYCFQIKSKKAVFPYDFILSYNEYIQIVIPYPFRPEKALPFKIKLSFYKPINKQAGLFLSIQIKGTDNEIYQ